MAVEVGDRRIEVVRDEGAAGATRVLVVDPVPEAEHEVVDEQLRAAVEELGKRLRPLVGLEAVLLFDRHPGQLLPLARKLVVAACELLLALQQPLACGPPFLARAGPSRHQSASSASAASLSSAISQPGPTPSAMSGSASRRSSSRSCTRVSSVAPSGASRSVTVSCESYVGPASRSGPTKPQRSTIRSLGTSSSSSHSTPPTSPSAPACQMR